MLPNHYSEDHKCSRKNKILGSELDNSSKFNSFNSSLSVGVSPNSKKLGDTALVVRTFKDGVAEDVVS